MNDYQIAAFILSGGASSRMGQRKALLEFGGEPLIFRTLGILEGICKEVTIVGSPENYRGLGLRVIADLNFDTGMEKSGTKSNLGPLAGIATALTATNSTWNLIFSAAVRVSRAEPWVENVHGRLPTSLRDKRVSTLREPAPTAALKRTPAENIKLSHARRVQHMNVVGAVCTDANLARVRSAHRKGSIIGFKDACAIVHVAHSENSQFARVVFCRDRKIE